jgi:hypothetical protein
MEEECKRRILDLIDERLRAERKVILEVLAGGIMKERKSVSGDFGEKLRQLRLELGHFNAVMEDLTREMQRSQANGSPAPLPAPKPELN